MTEHSSAQGTASVSEAAIAREAIQLLVRCAGYLTDSKDAAEGWKIYYAVDADIVKWYLAPEKTSAYARVFSTAEGEDTAVLLARLLAEFIFREFVTAASSAQSPNGALLIVPPHDEEIGRLIFDLADEVVDQHRAAERHLSEFLQRHSDAPSDLQPLAQWLIDSARDLVEFIDGESGPQSELNRLEALGSARLINVERYHERSGDGVWTMPLPDLANDKAEFERFSQSVLRWKRVLSEHKAERQATTSVFNDAYVLATVQFVNEAMRDERRRLVLITGTSGILKATAQVPSSPGAVPFADLYIRHPQAFMADAGFFARTDGESRPTPVLQLFNWLRLWFPERPRASTDVRHDRKRLIATQTTTIIQEWQTQVRTTAVVKKLDQPHGDAAWQQRAESFLKRVGYGVETLLDEFENRAASSTNALYTSAVWLGLWSRIPAVVEHAIGIPALRFDKDYTQAQRYFEKVISVMRSGGSHSKIVDIKAIYDDLAVVDQSHYHAHVIHALAYATKGLWAQTRTLCEVAILASDRLSESEKKKRMGREAAYLLAVAERRLAQGRNDLSRAEGALEEARRREDKGAGRDARFDSEELAIATARINFDVLLHDATPDIVIISKLFARAVDVLKNVETDDLPDVRRWVRQQVLVNALDLALLLRCARIELSKHVVREIHQFVQMAEDEHKIGADSWDTVAEFIYGTAVVVFSLDPVVRNRVGRRALKLSLPPRMRYDEAREKRFKALVRESMSEA